MTSLPPLACGAGAPGPPLVSILVWRALFLRGLRRSPWKNAVTVLGIAVGVASVLATVAASRAAVGSLREGVLELAGRARIQVSRPGGVPVETLAALRPLTESAVVVPVVEEMVLAPAIREPVRVLGVDLLLDAGVRELDGDADAGERERLALLLGEGALVPEAMARALSIERGGEIRVIAQARPVDVPVVSIVKPKRFGAAWDRTLLVDVGCAQRLFGRLDRVDRIEIAPEGGAEDPELLTRVRALVPAGMHVAPPSERAASTSRMVRALEFNLTALSGISLLVGCVLVATTLATSVVQRRGSIALLRSLGADSRQIAAALMAEAALLGLAGGAVGVALGMAGARGALASVRITVAAVVQGIPESEISFPWWSIVMGLTMGVATAVVAALLPLREALRTPPLQGLRRERPEWLAARGWFAAAAASAAAFAAASLLTRVPPVGGAPVPGLLSALAVLSTVLFAASPGLDGLARAWRPRSFVGLGVAPRIALASISAGRRRAAWACGAVGMAVALAVAVTTMVGSFRATVADYVNQTIRSDLWVRPPAPRAGGFLGRLDRRIVEIALDAFGPGVVDPFHEVAATFAGEPVALCAGEFRVFQRAALMPFRDGRDARSVLAEAIAKRGVLVSEPFANRFGVKEGDSLTLDTPAGPIERPVVAVFYDYSRTQGMVILDRPDFLAVFPDDGPREMALFLEPGTDAVEARDRLRARLAGEFEVLILLNRELRREAMRVFDKTFAITTALQLVSSMVALVAVATVLTALAEERRQDLALLRALGGSRGEVLGVVLCQGQILGLWSAVTGLAAGLIVGWILVHVVNLQSFGWTMRFQPPWTSVLAVAGAVVPACLAAGLVPAWRASRSAPNDLLRDDA